MLMASENTANIGVSVVKCGVLEAANFQPPNNHERTRFAMAAPILTQARLKEILHYDPSTGLFTRLITKSYNAKVGEVVGGLSSSGYLRCNIDGKLYYMHRLASLYMTGSFPPDAIDHINGVKTDNRWCNLRAVTLAENNRNLRRKRVNKSGVNGVYWAKREQRWIVQIAINGRRFHVGSFDNIHVAAAHRKAAEKALGYHENHGTVRQQ